MEWVYHSFAILTSLFCNFTAFQTRRSLIQHQYTDWFGHLSHLPEQITPSPENPTLQVQQNDPYVLVQVASSWQLCVSRTHSSLSITRENNMISPCGKSLCKVTISNCRFLSRGIIGQRDKVSVLLKKVSRIF